MVEALDDERDSLLQSNTLRKRGELAFSLLLQPVNRTGHGVRTMRMGRVADAIAMSRFAENR